MLLVSEYARSAGMELLDLLDRRDRPETGLFWGSERYSWLSIWEAASAAQAFVQSRGGTAALVCTNSPQAIMTLLGGLRAGGTIASMPLPIRQEQPEEYAHRIAELCAAVGATLLLVDDALIPLVQAPPTIELVAFSTALAYTGRPPTDVPCGTFVQFTSGTSGPSKGVVLTGDQLAANLIATLEVIDPPETMQVCSWLPLSHDMGLVGLLCNTWAAGGGLLQRDPSEFLANPLIWLDDIERRGVHVTAAPVFALEVVLRRISREPNRRWDLSSLRSMIIGAQPVPADVLQRTGEALASSGLVPGMLSPAYGLAEACLAVSMSPPLVPWKVASGDAVLSLGDGASYVGTTALVSCGPVLSGYELTIHDGEVLLDGPAMSSGYLGYEPRTAAHHTNDAGCLVDGELVIIGRLDDVLFVRGQKVQPESVERACETVVRPGTAVAIHDPDGTFAVIVEARTEEAVDRSAAASVRTAVSKAIGAAPSRVVFVARGTTLKTTSGKLQRKRSAEWLESGRLDIVADHRTVRSGEL